MQIQLTIIGLGQIGASIGLGLSDQGGKITRIGSDLDAKIMQQAQKIGAVDETHVHLNAAVRNADIVILALPLDQIRDMVEAIAPTLKEGSIVMDTAPVKVEVAKWMADLLPETSSYVGLTPVLSPRYLHSESYGITAAEADLFQDGLFCIVTPPGVSGQVVKFAADLTQLLGANPLFVDLYEIDGLMAATHLLPQLMSAALLNATLDQPGWNEARKVAGRSFAEIVGPASHLDDAEALVEAARLNRDNIVRKLDDVIAALQGLRNNIAQEDLEHLTARIKQAKAGVAQWWEERGGGNWLAEEMPKSDVMPTSAEVMGSLLGFGLGRKKKRDK